MKRETMNKLCASYMEDADWTGVERYHDEIFIVKNVKYNGSIAVALANN